MKPTLDAMQEVHAERDGAVVTLRLSRPDRGNAITTTMLAELLWAAEACAADGTVRALVLQGEGKGFCSGDDLRGMGALPEGFPFIPSARVSHASLQSVLQTIPKPVIAAIHGFAFGVGLDLAMACDFRLATEDAQLRDQRVFERGMHAVTGCAWFQPRAIGLTRALEFLILGTPYTGSEAAAAGMVTRAFPATVFDEEVTAFARKLAAGPTRAIGLMKRQVYSGLAMTHEAFMPFAANLRQEVEIEDRQEGIRAFLEKRPPHFTGR